MAFTAAQLQAGAEYQLRACTDWMEARDAINRQHSRSFGPLIAPGEPAETREQRIARETKALLRANMIGTLLLLAAGLAVLAAGADLIGWP